MKVNKNWLIMGLVVFLLVTPLIAFGNVGNQGYEIKDLLDLFRGIFSLLYTLFFIIAGIFILYAAFLYLTSGGEEEKVTKAKNALVYAVVAIVVAVLAVGVTGAIRSWIEERVEVGGGNQCTVANVQIDCGPGYNCVDGRCESIL